MDQAIQMTVGGCYFSSKRLLNEWVRKILHSTGPGNLLADDNFQFMEALFRRHPWAKHFQNIWDMRVIDCCGGQEGYCEPIISDEKLKPELPHYCLQIMTNTGEQFCFNYHHCIYPLPGLDNLRRGCRTAIRPEIVALKQRMLERPDMLIRCSVCYRQFPYKGIEIDHMPPFTLNQLVWDWLETETLYLRPKKGLPRGIYIDDVPLLPAIGIGRDGKTYHTYKIANNAMRKRWKEYHRRFALLRAVCIEHHHQISDLWTNIQDTFPSPAGMVHNLHGFLEWEAQRKARKKAIKLQMKHRFRRRRREYPY